MTFTVTQRIDALESKKADLQADLAQGGQYIHDGYGCVDWEPMSDYHKKVVKKRLAKIDNDLCKLYKLPEYVIAKNNFLTMIEAYIKNISPEPKKTKL